MAACLLLLSYVFNLLSETIVRRTGFKVKR